MRENRTHGSEGGEGENPSLPYVRPRGRYISAVEVRARVCHDSVAEGNCIRREAGWGATGGELSVRRITNPFRRGVATSLLTHGEVWRRPVTL